MNVDAHTWMSHRFEWCASTPFTRSIDMRLQPNNIHFFFSIQKFRACNGSFWQCSFWNILWSGTTLHTQRDECVLPSLFPYVCIDTIHSVRNYPKWAIDYESHKINVALNLCEHVCYLNLKSEFISFLHFLLTYRSVIMKCTFPYVWCLPMLICWFSSPLSNQN